jgi:hypothetical protein
VRDSASGLPCSRVSRRASPSSFSSIRSAQRRRIRARSFASSERHFGSAFSASAIARRVSATPIRGTSAIVSPVAGSSTAKVSPESDAISSSGWSTVAAISYALTVTPSASAISAHVPTVATFCIA